MSAYGKKLRRAQGDMFLFWCPGCNCAHAVNHGWRFNGDGDRPTFEPSILVNAPGQFHNPTALTCHSFVRDGRIQFLGDSTHALAGQTVDLPDWPR